MFALDGEIYTRKEKYLSLDVLKGTIRTFLLKLQNIAGYLFDKNSSLLN